MFEERLDAPYETIRGVWMRGKEEYAIQGTQFRAYTSF